MPKPIMSTVDKALAILRFFSVQKAELGLSELSRKAGYDKATTLRHMNALQKNGFIEQDPLSRKYRLGLAPINLARIREQSFPVQTVIKPHLDQLAADTGETAHATLVSGSSLLTAMISEPDRALRVFVDPAAQLPVHVTASGIVIAAYSSDDVRKLLLSNNRLTAYTDATPTTLKELDKHFDMARSNGLAQSDRTFENDVIGNAAAIFGPAGEPVGAIAIAAVATRYNQTLEQKIEAGLRSASRQITDALGGVTPVNSTGAW